MVGLLGNRIHCTPPTVANVWFINWLATKFLSLRCLHWYTAVVCIWNGVAWAAGNECDNKESGTVLILWQISGGTLKILSKTTNMPRNLLLLPKPDLHFIPFTWMTRCVLYNSKSKLDQARKNTLETSSSCQTIIKFKNVLSLSRGGDCQTMSII